MLTHEVVDTKMERHGQLVRCTTERDRLLILSSHQSDPTPTIGPTGDRERKRFAERERKSAKMVASGAADGKGGKCHYLFSDKFGQSNCVILRELCKVSILRKRS
jgi:hypothetical protein